MARRRRRRCSPRRSRGGIGRRPRAISDLLGVTPAMAELRRAVERAAAAPFAVLIEGESGSGKELVARAIHRGGPRRDRAFCTLNCAALPDDLVEAELFGHARGAFTGAVGERAGVFEEAHGGTLFLDEVGELSPRAQAKLLRVIQEGELRRVGENVSRRVDVRIVAATNRDLRQRSGRPGASGSICCTASTSSASPCRRCASAARTSPLLAEHFWREATRRASAAARRSAPPTLAALARYDWPGNVRELQNVLAALAVRSPRRGVVPPSALPAHVRGRRRRRRRRRLDEARRDVRGAVRPRRAGASRRPSRPRRRRARRHAAGADQADGAAGISAASRGDASATHATASVECCAYLRSPPAADDPGAARRRDAGLLADSSRARAIRRRRCSARARRRRTSPSCAAGSGSIGRCSRSTARSCSGAVRGDLGTSLRTEPAGDRRDRRALPATFELAFAAMVVAIADRDSARHRRGGAARARASITRRRRWRWSASRCRTSGSGRCWRSCFRSTLGWLPVSGRGTLAHLVLPAITLGAPLAAILARMTRASVLEELRELYVLAARARGVSRRARRRCARVPQQPDSDRHGPRPAVRRGADRRGDHRNDLRVAGRRPAADSVDQLPRLPAGAGLHPADRGHLRRR